MIITVKPIQIVRYRLIISYKVKLLQIVRYLALVGAATPDNELIV